MREALKLWIRAIKVSYRSPEWGTNREGYWSFECAQSKKVIYSTELLKRDERALAILMAIIIFTKCEWKK